MSHHTHQDHYNKTYNQKLAYQVFSVVAIKDCLPFFTEHFKNSFFNKSVPQYEEVILIFNDVKSTFDLNPLH